MATTTVQVSISEIDTGDGSTRETKQYRITIPKSEAERLSLEHGDEFHWLPGDDDQLILEPVSSDTRGRDE